MSNRPRILLVDVESSFLDAMRRVLSGWDVVTFQDAEAAASWVCADRAFDLVLCELDMPGTNGLGFLKRLADGASELRSRLVFLSAHVSPTDARGFEARTGRPLLVKPSSADAMRACVAEASCATSAGG